MSNTEKQSLFAKINSHISCRQVLNFMVILGFMLNYALRLNLTIAIVSMVRNTTGVVATNATELLDGNDDTEIDDGKFDWDAYKQNLIHGSFYWGYILTELPGGRLAELIGGRRVFGHSMLWASVLTAIIPFAAHAHFIVLIVVRVLLGFMLGASWPAILPMASVWIPPMDRSKFMSNMMASSLGAAITMPVCGFLIASLGWQSAFYFTGGLGIIWSICWFIFVFDTPALHPRITSEERSEIEDAIGTTTSKKRPTFVPWGSLLTSSAVWAIVITHGCSVFGYYTVVNQLPTYMTYILHYDIKSNGLLSSLPYLGKYLMALAASWLADSLRRSGRLTTTAVRKIFTSFAVLPPGILMIIQVYLGHDKAWSVAIFTIALTLNGAVTGGYLGNGLDIAPNFSGTIFGMANTLSSIGGFLSTFMVGTLTYNNQQYAQWQIIFWVLAFTYILGAVVYTLLGSGVLQSWNNPEEKQQVTDFEPEENVPLKNNKSITA